MGWERRFLGARLQPMRRAHSLTAEGHAIGWPTAALAQLRPTAAVVSRNVERFSTEKNRRGIPNAADLLLRIYMLVKEAGLDGSYDGFTCPCFGGD